jgi:putative ABC transport system permease protein
MDILILLTCEGLLLITAGTVCGLTALILLITSVGSALADNYGIFIHLSPPQAGELTLLGGIYLAGFLTSLIPALRAYRLSLSDGLTISI